MRLPPPLGLEVYVIRYRPPGADPGETVTADLWPPRARWGGRLALQRALLRARAAGGDLDTDEMVGAYVRAVVGTLVHVEAPDGTPIPDGATLWALRDRVAPELLEELVAEVTRLVAASAALPPEVAAGFSTPSGSADSPPTNNGTAGTVVPVVATS
jgi:hypothetical protein